MARRGIALCLLMGCKQQSLVSHILVEFLLYALYSIGHGSRYLYKQNSLYRVNIASYSAILYIYLFFPAARCLLCYIWYTCLYTTSTTTTTMAAPPQPKTLLGRYRPLAPTASVKVSPLCLGAMSFGQAW